MSKKNILVSLKKTKGNHLNYILLVYDKIFHFFIVFLKKKKKSKRSNINKLLQELFNNVSLWARQQQKCNNFFVLLFFIKNITFLYTENKKRIKTFFPVRRKEIKIKTKTNPFELWYPLVFKKRATVCISG